MRNLHAWRRLNEFRSDIKGEKKSIENEALRVESQITRLSESKQWLTDMAIKINQMQVNSSTVLERSRLVHEFKGYLRKKIGIERVEKAEADGSKCMGKDHGSRSNMYEDVAKDMAGSTFGREMNRERDIVMSKERNWLRDELGPMTRI